MADFGLFDPLGTGREGKRVRRSPALAWVGVVALIAVVPAGVFLVRDPLSGGEPVAVATIGRPTPTRAPPPPQAPAIAAADATGEAAAPRLGDGEVEIQNGVRIVRPKGKGAGGSLVLHVPSADSPALAAPDPRLLEATSYGLLPKIGPDGSRPATVYARPEGLDASAAGRPKLAILIGGMGLDARATAEAATGLPGPVTFGFAPFGDDLDGQARRVRDAGHEVVLQLPMEDYGQAVDAKARALAVEAPNNGERLRWLLGRFAGYAGVGNHLGGRFLADEGALLPVLREVAIRGLYFFDDGTARRSLATASGADLGLPIVRADVVLDVKADPTAIAEALSRLEALARERGVAVGSASAVASSLAVLTRYAAAAPGRGFDLVPVSAALRLLPGAARSVGARP